MEVGIACAKKFVVVGGEQRIGGEARPERLHKGESSEQTEQLSPNSGSEPRQPCESFHSASGEIEQTYRGKSQ